MNHRISFDEVEFRKDWDAGLTLSEMGMLHGMAVQTVSTNARRLNCPPRIGGRQVAQVVNGSAVVLQNGEWVRDARGVARWQAGA